MKNKRSLSILLLALLLILPLSALGEGALYQVSTLQALMQGDYYGAADVQTLLLHGDTGLGTFDALDGEMVVLDGLVYQAAYDGGIHAMGNDVLTPFANVAFIGDAQGVESSFEGGYAGLLAALSSLVPDANIPVVFRIEGTFDAVQVRSVPAQTEPYPPLTDAVKHQAVFEKDRAEGVIVGFRFPQYFGNINTTGYHLHFLSEDRSFGGHLLAMESGSFTLKCSALNEFTMVLPDSISQYTETDTTDEDIKAVEQH